MFIVAASFHIQMIMYLLVRTANYEMQGNFLKCTSNCWNWAWTLETVL